MIPCQISEKLKHKTKSVIRAFSISTTKMKGGFKSENESAKPLTKKLRQKSSFPKWKESMKTTKQSSNTTSHFKTSSKTSI